MAAACGSSHYDPCVMLPGSLTCHSLPQSCRSKLYLHISTCNTCNCVNANGNVSPRLHRDVRQDLVRGTTVLSNCSLCSQNVLVNVDTRHGLETSNVACKPWCDCLCPQSVLVRRMQQISLRHVATGSHRLMLQSARTLRQFASRS